MKTNTTLLQGLIATALLFLAGCAVGTLLSTHSLSKAGLEGGTYDLILYGGQNPYDYRTVAILDRAGDRYEILPYGAGFNYRVIKGLPADEALTQGNTFIGGISDYRTSETREIAGPDNAVIGYELRPVYMPLTTGWLGDLLTTSYLLDGEKSVTVYVGFKGEYSEREEGLLHGSGN